MLAVRRAPDDRLHLAAAPTRTHHLAMQVGQLFFDLRELGAECAVLELGSFRPGFRIGKGLFEGFL